jgi:hypothetical protein
MLNRNFFLGRIHLVFPRFSLTGVNDEFMGRPNESDLSDFVPQKKGGSYVGRDFCNID